MRAGRLVTLLLLAPLLTAGRAETVDQPRAFGHVIGDVLTQRLLLHRDGRDVAATAPPPERVGLWLERRPARVERDSEGRHWLVLDYQVVNVPREPRVVSLPALTIATTTGAPLSLPAWPVGIGPLAPVGAPEALRPDRMVPARPTAQIERHLAISIAALTLVVLAWLGWWRTRQWRDARRLPYARAWREMRHLPPTGADAWLVMHRAMDAAAGRVVQSATLPRLFADAPHLAGLRPRIEAFYRSSDQRFFAGEVETPPYPLRDLCRALRDLERRHHR